MKHIPGMVLLLFTLALPASAQSEVCEWVSQVNLDSRLLDDTFLTIWVSCRSDQDAPHTHPPPSGRTGTTSWSVGAGVEQWRGLVAVYFPSDQVDRALCIMGFESKGDPNAYNSSGASGLMQVLASWADDYGVAPSDLFIPEVNLRIAADLYLKDGWVHWNPWKRGECR